MSQVAGSQPVAIKHPDRFFIDGEWAAPSSGSKIDVITPSSEDLFVSVAEAQAADMNRAVAAARQAFDKGPWPRMSHKERAGYLREIAKQIRARSDELANIWTSEVGVLHGIARYAMPGVADTFEYYAGLADTFQWEEPHKPLVGELGLLVREPVGVVGAIIPWNGPMGLIAYKSAPALLAGCTLIIKVSPEAPVSGYVMAEACQAAGLPKGVVNVVTADREVSELLVRHPDVDKITFTGSSATGKRIASICGERIARVTLELGGKSAAVILSDYDMGVAAESISQSARFMSGQVCSSLTRLVVPQSKHDEFVDALSASFGAIKVGDPFQRETQMGPLAMERQRDRVEGYIAKGKAEGAKLATGGGRPAHLNRGYFVEPTVFANVNNEMTIAREEIFGPVLSVIPAKDEEDAIRIANDSVFGLNASVFTNDVDKAYAVSRRLLAGTVGHNGFRTDFSIAFGGFKQSGIGREGGVEGLHPFLEAKTVILEGKPSHVKG